MLLRLGGTYYFHRYGGRMTAIFSSERPELSATTPCRKNKENKYMVMGFMFEFPCITSLY